VCCYSGENVDVMTIVLLLSSCGALVAVDACYDDVGGVASIFPSQSKRQQARGQEDSVEFSQQHQHHPHRYTTLNLDRHIT
jgi:hypothetical protein